MNKLNLYALFNENDQWIGWSFSEIPAAANIKTRLVDPGDEQVNLVTCVWEGDYHTGCLVDRGKQNVTANVDEATLIRNKYDQLFRQYNFPTLLFALLNQINTWVVNGQIGPTSLDPEFRKMLDLQKDIEERYTRTLARFANSPHHNFVTEQQAREQFASTFNTPNRP